MKKLVFLHGSGADKLAYNDLMGIIAQKVNAELISFNAPFPHPSKEKRFVWFNKVEQNGRRDAVLEEYFYSLEYIKDKLKELSCDLNDIILIGHSQGGGIAVHTGVELNLNSVISICGDLPYNINYDCKSRTPIYWFEGGKDSYINQQRKESYKMLDGIKADLYYKILPTSTHNEFAEDLLREIKNLVNKFVNC